MNVDIVKSRRNGPQLSTRHEDDDEQRQTRRQYSRERLSIYNLGTNPAQRPVTSLSR